jgi:ABC-type nickel/cobalt efflux system permease component RcnA
MGGIDNLLVGLSDGATLPLVLLVAVLLGLRHATDPDHLAVVTGFITGSTTRANARAGRRLGLAWGLGHALTLVGLGLLLILYGQALPEPAERSAEILVGLVIIGLALRLFVRWRRGAFHFHEHSHGAGVHHAHLHSHEETGEHGHVHAARSPLGAFSVGLLHGAGGSGGVAVLLVASIHEQTVAAVALVLLGLATAVAMAAFSSGFGLALFRWRRVLPAPLTLASLGFGIWYLLAATSIVPYG